MINLAVVGPYHSLYTYKVKPYDADNLAPGCRFLVPFGNSLKVAFFVEMQKDQVPHRLRFVKERIDTHSPFPPALFEFCRWLSDYYFAGLGETLAAALPGTGTKKPRVDYVVRDRALLEAYQPDHIVLADIVSRLLRFGSIREELIAEDKTAAPVVREWIASGVLAPHYRVKARRKKVLGYRMPKAIDPESDRTSSEKLSRLANDVIYSRQDLLAEFGFSDYQISKLVKIDIFKKVFDESGVSELSNYPIKYNLPRLTLLEGQQKALDAITSPVRKNEFAPFLLFGITGSGKTLVYCHAAREAVEAGGTALIMVPEIALSGLLLSSFAAFFGDRVTIMHSGLTANQRFAVREKIASGEVRVVIGPRSAIFAPLKNLKIIIVDEEHDPSYKQDDPAPRYHGRDAAVMLGKMCSCPVILGSASPSIESYYNALSGRYTLLTLDQRPISGYKMPEIHMLDMKREKISGECSFMSYRLKRETEKHIAAGSQVIYYLNRRGFSPRLKCRECGEVPSCEDCGVTLTYHRSGNSLKCHFCDRVEAAPEICPHCGGSEFVYIGTGTQRVEENLARLFGDSEAATGVKAERIDSDKAATRSGQVILSDFAEEKFNLLVGTQMVTKGLDIPGVTLVGVLAADIGLDMPDFRAAEKTYAKLLQVAGRAGRGDREGHVMIQTNYDNHPVISHLVRGDYRMFYESVITERELLGYPPFSRLINITLYSEDEKLLETEALKFRIKLEEHLAGLGLGQVKKTREDRPSGDDAQHGQPQTLRTKPHLLGPAPAPMYKLRGNYRRRLIIKCLSVMKVVSRLRKWEAGEANFGLSSKIKPHFDIDPVNMM